MRKGNGWWFADMWTLLLVASVACQGKPSGQATRITVMVSGDAEEIEAYRAVVAGFNEAQDDVEANLIPFAKHDDLILRLSTSIAGGQPPDLFLMNYRFYGQFAAKGALEPVAPYLQDSEAFSEGDFFDTALTPFRWDGEQVCLPQNVSSLVVYYNADLFQDAGIDLPQDGWAWEEMVASAKTLTRGDGDGPVDTHGLGVDPEIIRVAPFIWSNGGRLVDDEASPRPRTPWTGKRSPRSTDSSTSGPPASPPRTRRRRPRTS